MTELCGRYVVVSAHRVIENACVTFNERIIGIERERGVPENAVVSHGLASIHTHLGLYPVRTTIAGRARLDEWVARYAWPWEKLLRREPELSYSSAILALSKLLLSGVTAVADMHFNEDRVAEALLRVGVRGDLSVALMSRGVYESLDVALEENVELVKKLRGKDLLKARLGPTTPRLLSPEEFREVVDRAEELGVGIHTHIAEVPEDSEYLEKYYGMSLRDFVEFVGLTRVNTIIAHAVWLDAEAAKSLAHPNVTIAHCPSSNVLLRDGIAPVRGYLDLGIRVGLGVDVSPSYSILDEIAAALPLHAGRGDLDARELFEAATAAGYRALHAGSGLLEIGEVADLVLWSLDEPVVDPVAGLVISGRVVELYVGGRRVVEEGSLLRVSESEVKELERSVSGYLKKCYAG